MDFKNIRLDYNKSKIDFNNLDVDPLIFFLKWFNDALKINRDEANACVLSTITSNNEPASRVVLLKDVSEKGFIFFTNYQSNKSVDIEINHNVALNFYWPELERQVRINGIARKIDACDSDDYFNSRPRKSQIGACLSSQSTFIDLDYCFSEKLKRLESELRGKLVNRPLHWGGYSINAHKIEFWQGRPLRLHDRVLYELDGKNWNIKRLAP